MLEGVGCRTCMAFRTHTMQWCNLPEGHQDTKCQHQRSQWKGITNGVYDPKFTEDLDIVLLWTKKQRYPHINIFFSLSMMAVMLWFYHCCCTSQALVDVPCQCGPDHLFHTHLHSSVWPTGHRPCTPDKPSHVELENAKSHTCCHDAGCKKHVLTLFLADFLKQLMQLKWTWLSYSITVKTYTIFFIHYPLSLLVCVDSDLLCARANTWGRGRSQWCWANHPASRHIYRTSYYTQDLHNRAMCSQESQGSRIFITKSLWHTQATEVLSLVVLRLKLCNSLMAGEWLPG